MKKSFFVLIVILLMLFIVGCDDPKNTPPTEYKVSFKVDEKIIDEKKVEEGKYAPAPSEELINKNIPEGKKFTGWSINDEKVDIKTYSIKADTTFTAILEDHVKYTVTLMSNGTELYTIQKYENEFIELSDYKPEDIGENEVFLGWSTEESESGSVISGSYKVTGNATLYAQIKQKEMHTLTFDVEVPADTQKNVETGTVITLPEPIDTNGFKYWRVNGEKVESPYTVSADTSFTAYYAFVISYSVNDKIVKKVGVEKGNNIDFSYKPDLDPSMTFKYWSESKDGVEASAQTASGDKIFYAVVEETPSFTITYHFANGTTEDAKYLKDTVITKFKTETASEGMEFLGWSLSLDGSVITELTMDKDYDLYPKFKYLSNEYVPLYHLDELIADDTRFAAYRNISDLSLYLPSYLYQKAVKSGWIDFNTSKYKEGFIGQTITIKDVDNQKIGTVKIESQDKAVYEIDWSGLIWTVNCSDGLNLFLLKDSEYDAYATLGGTFTYTDEKNNDSTKFNNFKCTLCVVPEGEGENSSNKKIILETDSITGDPTTQVYEYGSINLSETEWKNYGMINDICYVISNNGNTADFKDGTHDLDIETSFGISLSLKYTRTDLNLTINEGSSIQFKEQGSPEAKYVINDFKMICSGEEVTSPKRTIWTPETLNFGSFTVPVKYFY